MKNEREISGSVEGQLLIAVPHMEDPRFRHSVVYLCSHSRSGAVGLVVNKLINDMPFADLLEQPYVADVESRVWSFAEIPAKRESMMVDAMAPEFEVTDRKGYVVRMADLKGKKALIVTWSSW